MISIATNCGQLRFERNPSFIQRYSDTCIFKNQAQCLTFAVVSGEATVTVAGVIRAGGITCSTVLTRRCGTGICNNQLNEETRSSLRFEHSIYRLVSSIRTTITVGLHHADYIHK